MQQFSPGRSRNATGEGTQPTPALKSGFEGRVPSPGVALRHNENRYMVRWLSIGISAGLWLASSGCATFNPPAKPSTEYSVTPMAPQIFRINYQGEGSLPAERSLDLSLLRACQLTRERECSHFAVLDEEASSTGQIVYCGGLDRIKFGRGLAIKCFASRPKGIFSFNVGDLQHILEQKLNLNQ